MNIGDIIENKYEILSLIGQGELSKVYLALDKKVNKTWAIKVINKSEKLYYESIRTETEMLSSLNHSNIPRIVDIIEYEPEIIIVMDYIEGESIDKVLSYSLMSVNEVMKIASQLINVFEYIHSHNIVYRDLKPANIMLKPDFQIVLVDFGVAKKYIPGEINDTVCIGTRGYAAPEQYRGQSDKRTDVYSFGVTMFQMLTGISPHEYNSTAFSVKEINFDLPIGLDNIIKKCTYINPDDRYQSFEEIEYDFLNIDKMESKQNSKSLIRRIINMFSKNTKEDSFNKNINQFKPNNIEKKNAILFKSSDFVDYDETTILCDNSDDNDDYYVPPSVFEIKKTRIFLSYCNSDSDLADIICSKLDSYKYIEVSRYTTSVPYKGSFIEFMNGLDNHDKVIMIISDQYLKSRACMYEVGQLIKSSDFKKKILFIVCSNRDKKFYRVPAVENIEAKIYDPHDRNQYIIYWENKCSELHEDLNLIKDECAKIETLEDIRDIKRIISSDIGRFMKYLSDANGISFSDLYEHNFSEFLDDMNLV